MTDLLVGAATAVGQRPGNEDAYAVGARTWVLADGMGGHSAGEVAARAAADAALAAPGPRAVADGHRAVLAAATDRTADMGTTLVHAALEGDELVVRWAGDSRAYLLDGGELRLLTADHNQAEQLRAAGQLSAEQARHHRGQFLLTRALGLGAPEPPVADEVRVPARGRLLLASDGLSGELSDAQIAPVLAHGSPQQAAEALVAAAVQAGGSDNVTCVVVDLS